MDGGMQSGPRHEPETEIAPYWDTPFSILRVLGHCEHAALQPAIRASKDKMRFIDSRIASLFYSDVESDDGEYWISYSPPTPVPPYTTDLKAAMLLVPLGYKWIVDLSLDPRLNGHSLYAAVWPEQIELDSDDSRRHYGRHDNAALALCIAALREHHYIAQKGYPDHG